MRSLLARLALAFMLAFTLASSPHAWAATIDINTADATTLATLPGIGPSKSAAIIQYRTDHGAFKTVDELDNVPGIGPATMTNIRALVSVGGGTAPAATAAQATTPAATTTKAAATPAATTSAKCPVNINTADAATLAVMPGIGTSKAAAILQYRTDHGAFASCSALSSVSGIGPATIAGLTSCCVVQ